MAEDGNHDSEELLDVEDLGNVLAVAKNAKVYSAVDFSLDNISSL